MEAFFKEHWHVLCLDKTLNLVLPAVPKLIYRKVPNYGGNVVKKVLDPPERPSSFWDRDGFFACRKCKVYREVIRTMRGLEKFTFTSNN